MKNADIELKPLRPYMLRAYYAWLCDNQLTPHLLVDANYPNVDVPTEYVRDGEIVLNLAPHALGSLQLGDELVTFSASFGGVARRLSIPLGAIKALYARENNAGIGFPDEPFYQNELKSHQARSNFKIVDHDDVASTGSDTAISEVSDNTSTVPDGLADANQKDKPKTRKAKKVSEETDKPKKSKAKASHLKLIE